MTLTAPELRQEHDKAKKNWESSGKPQTTRALVRRRDIYGERYIDEKSVTHPLLVAHEETQWTLFKEARRLLRTGELQAIAIEVGAADSEYVELLPLHWRALAIRNWRESFIRRTTGPTCMLHVVVYDRASYNKVIASPAPGAGRLRQKQPTRADRILQIYESAPGDTRDQWKSRIDVARWVRQQLDGKGEDREARRYVLAVLKDKLDLRFVGSPDGRSEK